MTGEERGRISMDLWKKDLLETPIETIDIEAEAACKRHMDGKLDGKGIWIINQANVDALYGIIEICSKKIITPIMITTPYLSEYSNKIQNEFPSFFDEFYSLIEMIRKETGAIYCDYSCDSRFRDRYDLFFSVDHLNKQGALKFTDMVFTDYVRTKTE